jgi:uncharacterized membrane protein
VLLLRSWFRCGLLTALGVAGAASATPPGDSKEPMAGNFQSAELPPFCYEIVLLWNTNPKEYVLQMVGLNDASQLLWVRSHPRLRFTQAFVYHDGDFTNVGWHAYAASFPAAINNRGTVIGHFFINDLPTRYPYIWENARTQIISRAQVPSDLVSVFSAMNDQNRAVGWGGLQGPDGSEIHMILVRPDGNGSYEMIDISPPTTPGMRRCDRAHDINDAGVVVGRLSETAGQCNSLTPAQAAISMNGLDGEIQGFELLPQIQGADPNAPSWASAINDLGDVVGLTMAGDGLFRAVVWKEGKIHELDLSPMDINNHGEIVGTIRVGQGAGAQTHAALLTDGKTWDLNEVLCEPLTGGSYLWHVYAINDASEIIGTGLAPTTFDLQEFEYYLVPRVRAVSKTRK